MGKRGKPQKKKHRPLKATTSPSPKGGQPYAIAPEHYKLATAICEDCGKIWATVKEVAVMLRLSEEGLYGFWDRCPDAKRAYEDGKLHGNISLRRDQRQLAVKNASMSMFLGMNQLGQQDLRGVHLTGGAEMMAPLATVLERIAEHNRRERFSGPQLDLKANPPKDEEAA